MDCDIFPLLQHLRGLSDGARRILPRSRHTAVFDRKRHETNAVTLSEHRHLAELQILIFVRCEQRDYCIDSCGTPAGDFVFQPVAATRTGGDRQLARPSTADPIELRVHLSFRSAIPVYSFTIISRSRTSTSTPRDLRIL